MAAEQLTLEGLGTMASVHIAQVQRLIEQTEGDDEVAAALDLFDTLMDIPSVRADWFDTLHITGVGRLLDVKTWHYLDDSVAVIGWKELPNGDEVLYVGAGAPGTTFAPLHIDPMTGQPAVIH